MRTFIRLLLQKEDYSCFFAQKMVKYGDIMRNGDDLL